MKRCTVCKRELSKSEFGVRKASKDGLAPLCKSCAKVKSRDYRRKHPDRYRASKDRQFTKQYGLTPEEYWELHEKQEGKCAICGTTEPGKGKQRLSIDHCHETGRVRGLLCNHCNRGIGLLRDDPELLDAASKYLKEN